jgi:hypothetical protein
MFPRNVGVYLPAHTSLPLKDEHRHIDRRDNIKLHVGAWRLPSSNLKTDVEATNDTLLHANTRITYEVMYIHSLLHRR